MFKLLRIPFIVAALALSAAANADYPEKTIRLIVPYAPGGNIDATARNVSEGLSKNLGQQVIVENRPGAGGVVGSEYVVRAEPDGYTMLLGSTGTLGTNRALGKLSFDPLTELEAVSTIARVPLVLVLNPQVPAKTFDEFLAYAKANPGKLTMASAGTGTSNHMAGELFQDMSGTKFLHIPYKGSGQALTDLMGGQVDLMFDQVSSSLPFITSGKLRALGVTTTERSGVLPDLPTLDESGLPGFEASTTAGILLPGGTPKPIVEKVSAALNKVLELPETNRNFQNLGADVVIGSPDDFRSMIEAEIEKWSDLVKKADIEIQ